MSDEREALPPEPGPRVSLHQQFADKYLRLKELEQEVKQIKEEISVIEQALIEKFAEDGVKKMSLEGGVTLRVDCKIWPKILTSNEEAIAAIKAAGMTELLTKENYQTQTLASFLRELDKNDEPLPKEFQGIIAPNPVYKIIANRY
jgi:hypothetical protein